MRRSALKTLLVGRVDTERPIQPTETRHRVEPQSERTDTREHAGRSPPRRQSEYRHDAQDDGEQGADESVPATDVLLDHTWMVGRAGLVSFSRDQREPHGVDHVDPTAETGCRRSLSYGLDCSGHYHDMQGNS